MTAIALEIIFNWVLMGIILSAVMVIGLYFAILCEKFIDYLRSQ